MCTLSSVLRTLKPQNFKLGKILNLLSQNARVRMSSESGVKFLKGQKSENLTATLFDLWVQKSRKLLNTLNYAKMDTWTYGLIFKTSGISEKFDHLRGACGHVSKITNLSQIPNRDEAFFSKYSRDSTVFRIFCLFGNFRLILPLSGDPWNSLSVWRIPLSAALRKTKWRFEFFDVGKGTLSDGYAVRTRPSSLQLAVSTKTQLKIDFLRAFFPLVRCNLIHAARGASLYRYRDTKKNIYGTRNAARSHCQRRPTRPDTRKTYVVFIANDVIFAY